MPGVTGVDKGLPRPSLLLEGNSGDPSLPPSLSDFPSWVIVGEDRVMAEWGWWPAGRKGSLRREVTRK